MSGPTVWAVPPARAAAARRTAAAAARVGRPGAQETAAPRAVPPATRAPPRSSATTSRSTPPTPRRPPPGARRPTWAPSPSTPPCSHSGSKSVKMTTQARTTNGSKTAFIELAGAGVFPVERQRLLRPHDVLPRRRAGDVGALDADPGRRRRPRRELPRALPLRRPAADDPGDDLRRQPAHGELRHARLLSDRQRNAARQRLLAARQQGRRAGGALGLRRVEVRRPEQPDEPCRSTALRCRR